MLRNSFHIHVLKLALGALLLLCSTEAMSAGRIAFVVGNSAYEEVKVLANPENDATDVADRLKSLGFALHGDKVHLNMTLRGLLREFNRFVKSAKGKDIAFFYFAGHGMQFSGEPHVLPVDVPNDDLNIVKKAAVSLNTLLAELDNQARLTIAVFDACREIPDLNKRIARATRGGDDSQWRGLSRPQVSTRATLVAYSGGSGELVADGEGRNSPYTEVLLKYLSEERIRQDRLDILGIFSEVSYEFREKHNDQNPEVINQGVRQNVHYFVSLEDEQRPTPLIPEEPIRRDVADLSARSLDLEFYSRAERRNTQLAYEAYLAEFPQGRFSRLARLSLADIKAEEKARIETEQLIKKQEEEARKRSEEEALARAETAREEQKRQEAERRSVELALARDKAEAKRRQEESFRKEEAKQSERSLGLNRDDRRAVQRGLNHLGFNVGGADGQWGARTRAGISAWQASIGGPSTGYLLADEYRWLLDELPDELRISPSQSPLCEKYAGYTPTTWRRDFLNPTRNGTYHIFVRSFRTGQTVEYAQKVRAAMRSEFRHLDFNIMPTESANTPSENQRWALVIVEGITDVALARELLSYTRSCGVADDAFGYQQSVGSFR